MKIDRNSAVVGLIIGLLLASLAWSVASGGDGSNNLATSDTAASEITDTTISGTAGTVETDEVTDTTVATLEYTPISDLPTVERADLPYEANETIDLILQGGPYPFNQDDGVFQNREELLPDRELGHYREYTVITPGSSDRGARRIVAGEDGEMYYTSDHYDSFEEIIQ